MHPGLFLAAMSVLVLLAGLGTIYVGRKKQSDWPSLAPRGRKRPALSLRSTSRRSSARRTTTKSCSSGRRSLTPTPSRAEPTRATGLRLGDQTKGSRNDAQKLLAPY